MSQIKAPNFRDVVPACCYNCQESKEYRLADDSGGSWMCKKYSHNLGDAGLKICDDYDQEEY